VRGTVSRCGRCSCSVALRCVTLRAARVAPSAHVRFVACRVLLRRSVRLLQSLSPRQLYRIAEVASVASFAAGETILEQGK
jgi:hypothetical protein